MRNCRNEDDPAVLGKNGRVLEALVDPICVRRVDVKFEKRSIVLPR